MKFPFFIVITVCAGQAQAEEVTPPRVLDSQLEVSLLASEPEVVTPVGLTADRQGGLYVVETHTHARNARYMGPRNDRILVFEDTDGDGHLDHRQILVSILHPSQDRSPNTKGMSLSCRTAEFTKGRSFTSAANRRTC